MSTLNSMPPVIVSAALVGSQPTKEMNRAVPYSPAEIADSAVAAYRAGAAIVHIHVRDPDTGEPSSDLELFSETVDRIRVACPVLINLTTSGLNLGQQSIEQRLAPLTLKPEIASLDAGSFNLGDRIFLNSTSWAREAAQSMLDIGVKPELELFDVGHVDQANTLVQAGLIASPPWFQLCMGIRWGIPATVENLVFLRRKLPHGAVWSVLGEGRHQLEMTTVAPIMGGHIRVGFEDNILYSRGVLAKSNAQLVARAVKILHLLNLEPATVSETRAILGIPSGSLG